MYCLIKVFNNFFVVCASTVVVAERVVSETTVSVNVNVLVVVVFDTKFDANAYGSNFAKVIGGMAQRSSAGVNRFDIV